MSTQEVWRLLREVCTCSRTLSRFRPVTKKDEWHDTKQSISLICMFGDLMNMYTSTAMNHDANFQDGSAVLYIVQWVSSQLDCLTLSIPRIGLGCHYHLSEEKIGLYYQSNTESISPPEPTCLQLLGDFYNCDNNMKNLFHLEMPL